MSAQPALRRGWCPGALTPMQTGDGWLVRVRPRAGRYSLAELSAIAEAARACGNGEIDLTNRANLQIRGLSQQTISLAQDILARAGLLDETAEREARRNVLVAPLAGIDPQSGDVLDVATELDAALRDARALRALPGKFGFAVDGGGIYALREDTADIVIRVTSDEAAIALGGDNDRAARVPRRLAASCAVRLAEVFAQHAKQENDLRRMRDLVAALSAVEVFRLAGLSEVEITQPRPQPSRPPIGTLGPAWHPWAIGLGLPFGRISADGLRALVEAADSSGVIECRPSPERILYLPLGASNERRLLVAAKAAGLIACDGDARLKMDVCPGAPACSRGTTSTRADAAALAAHFPDLQKSVHVSGCAKGCARSAPSDVTFVAHDGRYDVICKGNTSATPVISAVAPDAMCAAFARLAGASHV